MSYLPPHSAGLAFVRPVSTLSYMQAKQSSMGTWEIILKFLSKYWPFTVLELALLCLVYSFFDLLLSFSKVVKFSQFCVFV